MASIVKLVLRKCSQATQSTVSEKFDIECRVLLDKLDGKADGRKILNLLL